MFQNQRNPKGHMGGERRKKKLIWLEGTKAGHIMLT
jgi:hypothetical protein